MIELKTLMINLRYHLYLNQCYLQAMKTMYDISDYFFKLFQTVSNNVHSSSVNEETIHVKTFFSPYLCRRKYILL